MNKAGGLFVRWMAGALALCLPMLAYGHSPYPGVRGFYVGALHPLTTPSHVLLIVAISLLLGIRVASGRMRLLAVLFSATASGLILAFVIAPYLPSTVLILVLITLVGVLIIVPLPLPHWALAGLAGVSGFLLALESIPDPGAFLDVVITVAGSLVGIHYLIMYGSRGANYLVERWNTQVTDIGIKVAGSWISAIGILMLAFTLSGL